MKAINNGKKNLNLISGKCRKDDTCEVTPAEMMNMRKYFIQVEESVVDDFPADQAVDLMDEYGYLKGHPLWNEYSNTEKGRLNKLRAS